jgi:murein endopeptidase
MRRDEITHEFEAKILWQSEKVRLIETTLPLCGHHKFFLPKSKNVTIDCNESDGDGNWMFKVSDWWMHKVMNEEFWADE